MTDDQKPSTALIPRPPRSFSLLPSTLGEAREMAEMIAKSAFAPKDYKGNPDSVLIAIQMGADVGLKPMQALQNIAVINGRPCIWGDAALALATPALERCRETFEGEEGTDGFTAVCIVKRKGWPDETRRTFSVKDAKLARLWKKAGPWETYPKRMLQMRARGFALRDAASDLLLGLILAEEATDYTDTIDATVIQVEGPPPVLERLEKVEDAVRESIEKGFETLSMSEGARLAKLNEYLLDPPEGEGKTDIEVGAKGLVDWLRDEYAKRKFGQPRAPSGNSEKPNAKPPEPKVATGPGPKADPPTPKASTAPAAEDIFPAKGSELF